MAGRSPFPPGSEGMPYAAGEPAVERPTQAAELKLMVGPARAEGKVPSVDARYLITAFGIVVCVAAGIVGVVFTLRIASGVAALRADDGITVLVLAELSLGLTGAVLVALCGRRRERLVGAGGQASELGRD